MLTTHVTGPGGPLQEVLTRSIREANRTSRSRGHRRDARDGMGTTVTALLLVSDGRPPSATSATRALPLRDGDLTAAARDDHSVAGELVRRAS